MPVRYHPRTYGETKISRFRHGWLLVRMAVFAYRKLKIQIYEAAGQRRQLRRRIQSAGTLPAGPGTGWSSGCETGGASSGPSK